MYTRNVKELYLITDAYNSSATQKVSETTHLNCSANSSGQCSYEWSHRDRSMIATVGHSLEIDEDHPGLYVCAAKCTIREHQCRVTAAVVEFSAVGMAIYIFTSCYWIVKAIYTLSSFHEFALDYYHREIRSMRNWHF